MRALMIMIVGIDSRPKKTPWNEKHTMVSHRFSSEEEGDSSTLNEPRLDVWEGVAEYIHR